MADLLFKFDPATGRNEVVAPLVHPKLAPPAKERFHVPPGLKVSCPSFLQCRSPSKRDPAKPKAWICGGGFCHVDRLDGCVEYRRLSRGGGTLC